MLALAGALALAGCGVKGPLELPPGAHAAPPAATATAAAESGSGKSGAAANQSLLGASGGSTGWQSGTSTKNPSATPEQLKGASRPKTPFILDGLL
ncbi:LPS translocon maturation chaperone LptM [Xanthobacter tagetidis]|uniref:LPS translocon maturation chaperone LptM n=1 Tax=Xanthobacter tagetidis TaxID=60216 RepID=UPI0017D21624|nr:lipoprotein [Xanthobacter tagetidis]MBB6308755.1 putative small lipoprotein YifL [Xanthobacter tagetidis]